MAIINFSKSKQQQLKDETANDLILCELMNTIVTGWHDRIKQLATDLRVHWSFRHELAIEASVVCKGRQILIPQTMQSTLLQQLHQGIVKTQQFGKRLFVLA